MQRTDMWTWGGEGEGKTNWRVEKGFQRERQIKDAKMGQVVSMVILHLQMA